MPSVPSQLLEGAWAAVGVLILGFVARRLRFGTVFLWALGWWLVGRIAVGFSWRDQATVGPLNVEQALAVLTLAVIALLLVGGRVRARQAADSGSPEGLTWPERPIDPTELPPATGRPG